MPFAEVNSDCKWCRWGHTMLQQIFALVHAVKHRNRTDDDEITNRIFPRLREIGSQRSKPLSARPWPSNHLMPLCVARVRKTVAMAM